MLYYYNCKYVSSIREKHFCINKKDYYLIAYFYYFIGYKTCFNDLKNIASIFIVFGAS